MKVKTFTTVFYLVFPSVVVAVTAGILRGAVASKSAVKLHQTELVPTPRSVPPSLGVHRQASPITAPQLFKDTEEKTDSLSPRARQLDTSTWQIYKNDNLRFSILYPRDWKVEFKTDSNNLLCWGGMVGLPNSTKSLEIKPHTISESLEVQVCNSVSEKPELSFYDIYPIDVSKYRRERYLVSGSPTFIYYDLPGEMNWDVIFIVHQNKLYILSGTNISEYLFKQFLDGFSFLNP